MNDPIIEISGINHCLFKLLTDVVPKVGERILFHDNTIRVFDESISLKNIQGVLIPFIPSVNKSV